MHEIIVAGIGPGNPAYLLPAAAEAIAGAKVLVGGRRALAQYAQNPAAGQKTMAVTRDIEAVMGFIRGEWQRSDVVVMVSGDPGYYSLLDALRRHFPAGCLRVIPGLSAMQLAFARLALPWHEARLLSFHGRVPKEQDLTYEPGCLAGMLTDRKYTSKTIPAVLMAHGWPKKTRLFICTRLSYADESIVETTLGGAAALPEVANGILIVMDEKAENAEQG